MIWLETSPVFVPIAHNISKTQELRLIIIFGTPKKTQPEITTKIGGQTAETPKSLSSAQAAPPSGKSSKVLAGLAFCECPRSAFRGFCRGHQTGFQQQFVTQILRVHLFGIDKMLLPISQFGRALGA